MPSFALHSQASIWSTPVKVAHFFYMVCEVCWHGSAMCKETRESAHVAKNACIG